MGFLLVPKSVTLMTLNSVMAIILRYYTDFGSFGGPITSKWLKIDLYCLQQECSPKIIYGDVRRGYRERAHYTEKQIHFAINCADRSSENQSTLSI